ncbi:MAG: methylmalonyl-CoA carboxyltransferase, partial [Bdellovibrionales bacterium]|nr:methylmalonyl-CoA carboxyltransferase [Bdellovibrionales bacterium]
RDKFSNPWCAAELGYIDAVIRPEETRGIVVQAFNALRGKRQNIPKKKHGNIPL